MLPLTNKNQRLARTYNRYFNRNSKKAELKVLETESSYHYELEIPGYVKEDFNFYVSQDNLVLTTERSKVNQKAEDNSKNTKHSYCYPSAYFKMKIPLPSSFIKKEIFVDYKNKILSFDLFKSRESSDDGLLT